MTRENDMTQLTDDQLIITLRMQLQDADRALADSKKSSKNRIDYLNYRLSVETAKVENLGRKFRTSQAQVDYLQRTNYDLQGRVEMLEQTLLSFYENYNGEDADMSSSYFVAQLALEEADLITPERDSTDGPITDRMPF